MQASEFNFDGLVGPTHHFGGLAKGNVASESSRGSLSNPKQAALQGLEKMLALHRLGIGQAVLPPHERPYIPFLRAIGFRGSDEEILLQAKREASAILMATSSSAAMWCANAATVTPSADAIDGRIHFTAANLCHALHRSLESSFTHRVLKKIFDSPEHFIHHPPLPSVGSFADEGAANHTRFCRQEGDPGLHFFVYGRHGFPHDAPQPRRYPARQTLEASQAIARQHGLPQELLFFAQQNPDAIDAGVFHNDVISTGNRTLFLCHEEAFIETDSVLQALQEKASALPNLSLQVVKIPSAELSLQEAVSTYFFNSQVVTLPNGKMALIAPEECKEHPKASALCQRLYKDPKIPIDSLYFLPLNQSMRNGGGPACLRLRIVLTPLEQKAMQNAVIFTEPLYKRLKEWIEKHYRDRLTWQDLGDPRLLHETREALDELSKILKLGSIYPFQQG